jgi:hypothetical protein
MRLYFQIHKQFDESEGGREGVRAGRREGGRDANSAIFHSYIMVKAS